MSERYAVWVLKSERHLVEVEADSRDAAREIVQRCLTNGDFSHVIVDESEGVVLDIEHTSRIGAVSS